MSDVLIRGLRKDVIARIDEEAANRGMSRNEFLVTRLEQGFSPRESVTVTGADLQRASRATADLLDDDLMAKAWR